MISTIFFDLDGVIIDSEPIHAKAKKIVLDNLGIKYPESIFSDYKGQPDDAFFKHISVDLDTLHRPFEELAQMKKEATAEIFHETPVIKDFYKFIESVRNNNIKTALVSSTSLFTFDLIEKYFSIKHFFDIIITEVDTPNHKPHPEPYLLALTKLGVTTSEVVVIEDSPNGIRAAKDAGCTVFALTTSFSRDQLTRADIIFDNYKELAAELGLKL